MAAKTITFSKPAEDNLFDGADAEDLAKIDLPASIAKFGAELTRRIEQTYPDAEVKADSNRSNGYYASGFGDLDADIEVAAVAQQLAEELFDDGALWMVDAE